MGTRPRPVPAGRVISGFQGAQKWRHNKGVVELFLIETDTFSRSIITGAPTCGFHLRCLTWSTKNVSFEGRAAATSLVNVSVETCVCVQARPADRSESLRVEKESTESSNDETLIDEFPSTKFQKVKM